MCMFPFPFGLARQARLGRGALVDVSSQVSIVMTVTLFEPLNQSTYFVSETPRKETPRRYRHLSQPTPGG